MLEDVITRYGGREVGAMEYYGDVFKLGDGLIQRNADDARKLGNPLIVGMSGHGTEDERMHRYVLFEDTFAETLEMFSGFDWAIISGCSYWGRENTAARQDRCFALTFDLDYVDDEKLNNLLHGAFHGIYPVPTYVNLSGGGVHLTYVLEEPLSLYPNVKTQLKKLKYALTDRIWNRYTSRAGERSDVQHQGINQGFRIVGGKVKPKYGGGRVRSFRLTPHPTDIASLNDFVPDVSAFDTSSVYAESNMTLGEAKTAYPEWYRRRVEEGEPARGWYCKPDLYEWWLRTIREEASYGHRYFCVMCLAIFAAKSAVILDDPERVRRDALSLLPAFNAIAPEHPFDEHDVDSALECLDERYHRFPRDDVAKISGIPIKENKRNHRPQKMHMQVMRAVQDIDYPDGTWRNEDGGPVKREAVWSWQESHPEGSKSQCARDTGLSRVTVTKWWDENAGGHWWRGGDAREAEGKGCIALEEGIKGGRPKGSGTKQSRVLEWRASHPEGTKAECARDTGIDPKTIRRWWSTGDGGDEALS